MVLKGYTFHNRVGIVTSDRVLPGKLDEAIASRLDHRRWGSDVRLRHFRNGKMINEGPRREGPWGVVGDLFSHTIQADGWVDDEFRVRGATKRLFSIRVREVDKGDLVIEAGKTEIGTQYVFGAANGPEDPGADEFDCSGFTQWAWATVGVALEHGAELQRVESNVNNFTTETSARNGDLVFMWFPNDRNIPSNEASHVGLHYGDGPTGMVLDTRNPVTSPVGIRASAGVIGYGRPS